ncbi:hypothetical protein CVT26_015141 [Gymnopilus dilepis]|uniref:Uncharacterized protein n=1 Tax=Gymnopilus dilepis TaxID=231916 RepID=A0A409YEW5_9AGAR|nr:hypothetical protein CVT26_015141 [Gymnopilus dilepis]
MPHSCHQRSCRGFQEDTDACYCGHSAADHGIVPMFVPPRGGQAEIGCTAYRRRNIYSHLRSTPDQTRECCIDWLKHDGEIDEAPGPAPAPTHLAAQSQATAWVAPVRPMPTTAQARASAPWSTGPSISQRPAPFGPSTPLVVPQGPFLTCFYASRGILNPPAYEDLDARNGCFPTCPGQEVIPNFAINTVSSPFAVATPTSAHSLPSNRSTSDPALIAQAHPLLGSWCSWTLCAAVACLGGSSSLSIGFLVVV